MSHLNKGDVVLVQFPFSSGAGTKLRPALVVQEDGLNARLTNTIIAMITTNTGRAGLPTQALIDITTPEGRQSGLHHTSLVNGTNLFTIEQSKVLQRIGSLSPRIMARVDECLKKALAL
jgi:mRNA interferase MazF